MADFTIRTTSPAGLYLPYYMRVASGGLNTCILGNQAVQGADVLFNCTGFSQGRALEVYYEITPNASGNPFAVFNADAELWFSIAQNNGFRTGQTPEVGAIGVYTNGSTGHVCNLERFYNGRWEISESHYYYDYQQGVIANGSWDFSYLQSNLLPFFIGADTSWRLLGFIYPFDGLTPYTPTASGGLASVLAKRRAQKRKGFILYL